jgi:hypothetical protein
MRWDIRIAAYFFMAAACLAVCAVAAPDYLSLTGIAGLLCFWGGMLGAILFAVAGFRAAFLGEEFKPKKGHRRRMIGLYGMVVCAVGLLGFSAAYFWPSKFHNHDEPVVSETATGLLDYTVQLSCDQMFEDPKLNSDQPLRLIQIIGPPAPNSDPRSFVATTSASMTNVGSLQIDDYETYKCTFKNYSRQPLLGLRAKLLISWSEAIPIQGGSRSGESISAIEYIGPAVDLAGAEGSEAFFYLRSTGQSFASVQLSEQITFLVAGSDKVHIASLISRTVAGQRRAMFVPRADYVQGRKGLPRVAVMPSPSQPKGK